MRKVVLTALAAAGLGLSGCMETTGDGPGHAGVAGNGVSASASVAAGQARASGTMAVAMPGPAAARDLRRTLEIRPVEVPLVPSEGQACPTDLSYFAPQLQAPDAASLNPKQPVSQIVGAHGGKRAATARVREEIGLYQAALDKELADRDAFDPAARAAADARIAALEDSILLSSALLVAIECQ